MKKSKARLQAEAEAWWSEEALSARWNAFIGPRQPLSARIRVVKPLPPRERGRARMERGVNFEFQRMRISGALMPGYVRDSKIATMRMHLDDIASIVDETIADDDEAGRLLTTIGYALDHMFGLGHMDGAHEPSCRVREHDRASAKGREKSLETRQGKAEVWLTSVRSIWWDKRGRFPKVGRLRPGGMSQKGLAQWILTNYTGVADPDRPRAVVIPNLPTDEESLVTAFKKWEKD